MDQRIFLDPEIVGPEDEREAKVRAGFWASLRRAARAIPFSADLVAAYYCALDPTTPRRVRLTLLGALAAAWMMRQRMQGRPERTESEF